MKYKKYILIMILLFAFTVKAEGEATIGNIKVNGTLCNCSGYDCTVNVIDSSATITYDKIDKDATVDRLSGFKIDLLSEVTTIKLTVTNSTNDEKIENIYNLTINKQKKENDLSLKSLQVNGENIELTKDVIVYSYISEYDATSIKIDAVLNDTTNRLIKENEYPFPIEESSISIDFKVKPVSGDELSYRVVVTRGVKPNTTLKILKINDIEIALKDKQFDYEVTVPYSVNELKIDATPTNKEAKIEYDSKTLVVGENEVKIKVTNAKVVNEYKINVIREDNVDKSVANLKKLEVEEYNRLDFDENVIDYTLNFNKVPEKLTIKAKAKDENGKIEIVGNEDLTDGSKVIVKVKLDNVIREYTLLVKEGKSVTSNKTTILISIIILVITIIVLAIHEIHTKQEKKREYLRKIFDLRHKIERKRKEEKESKKKEKSSKEKKIDDDLEII